MKPMVLVFGGAALIYVLLAILMGVLPGFWLSATAPGPNVEPLTPLQAQGRQVYVSNGCAYCHTQQVRPLAMDSAWGRPTARGDFAYRTPPLAGSERTGPDLSNVGKRRASEVWQYLHLYNPRAVMPASIMPPYPWLFEVVPQPPEGTTSVPVPKEFAPTGGAVIPTDDAKALVAYLLSLQQAPIPEYSPPARSNPHAAAAGSAGGTGRANDATAAQGRQVYAAQCSACHQADGNGLPQVFPSLRRSEVVDMADPTEHIRTVLYGRDTDVYASPMPEFGSILTNENVAAVINHERTLWGSNAGQVSPDQVDQVRKNGK